MEQFLIDLHDNYPNITRLYSIGKSVLGRELYVMEITNNPGTHDKNKPEVKYIGNMHGNEVVGREILLLLLKYLCENYIKDTRATKIVNSIRLHVMPSMNPDGYEASKLGDVDGIDGRNNANNVDLNRNFPDQYGKTRVNIFISIFFFLFFHINLFFSFFSHQLSLTSTFTLAYYRFIYMFISFHSLTHIKSLKPKQ